VLLVLEGGVNTLCTAASAIKNSTPVVIVQGSGRAADFIAKAYEVTKSKKYF
jgi:transient receptor potential cation channel subfamily M protein 2